MIRAFFVDFVFPLLLFLIVRSLLRGFLASFRAPVARRGAPQVPPAPEIGELKKDPVCGTYVSTAASVSRTVNGQIFYFCSKECRERYSAG
jgi:YHS domain-containing protein